MNTLIQDIIKLQHELDQVLQQKVMAIQKQEYLKAARQRVRERVLLDKARILLKELTLFLDRLPEAEQQKYQNFYQQVKNFFSLNRLDQLTTINQEKARLEDELEKLQQQKKQLLSEYRFQLANTVREQIAEISEKILLLENKANAIQKNAIVD